jgi:hypothetical protein
LQVSFDSALEILRSLLLDNLVNTKRRQQFQRLGVDKHTLSELQLSINSACNLDD